MSCLQVIPHQWEELEEQSIDEQQKRIRKTQNKYLTGRLKGQVLHHGSLALMRRDLSPNWTRSGLSKRISTNFIEKAKVKQRCDRVF